MTVTMAKASGELTTKEREKPSHIVIITMLEGETITDNKPKEFYSLPDATKWSDEQIKSNPGMRCDIYQLRAELVGEVVVHRKDYNN